MAEAEQTVAADKDVVSETKNLFADRAVTEVNVDATELPNGGSPPSEEAD